MAVIVTDEDHDSWKSTCTWKGITLLKSVSLPAKKPAICILEFKVVITAKIAFVATHLLIKKKYLSLNAMCRALETILRYVVVIGGRAYIRYRPKVRSEGFVLS